MIDGEAEIELVRWAISVRYLGDAIAVAKGEDERAIVTDLLALVCDKIDSIVGISSHHQRGQCLRCPSRTQAASAL